MKKLLTTVAAIVSLVGCARFSTTQTDLSYDEKGAPQRQITTKATAYTLCTSKSQLTNWKATQTDKSQGATVGSLTQESSTTNEAAFVQAVVSAAVSAAVKAK